MEFRDYFLEQVRLHPAMEAQDAVKLCYQAAFGAEHLLQDREAAYQYLKKEYAAVEADSGPLYEQIHPHVCRVNLGAWKRERMPLEWLFYMFTETASDLSENEEQVFRDCLDIVEQLIVGQKFDDPAAKLYREPQAYSHGEKLAAEPQAYSHGEKLAAEPQAHSHGEKLAAEPQAHSRGEKLAAEPQAHSRGEKLAAEPQAYSHGEKLTAEPSAHNAAEQVPRKPSAVRITTGEWRDFLAKYSLNRPVTVRHSERYRSSEHPAYRLVCSQFTRLFPILQAIAHMPQRERIVALDGRCASGKTTLAEQLAKVTGAGMVHMDDFFLPPELRSPERLAEPGGNVHYERFMEEVLEPLRSSKAFRYCRFDCSRMEPGSEREVREGNLRIVEGAYSCHPAFGEYMGLRVFCDVEPQEQLRRIEQRDGAEMLEDFRNRWIPMEEQYFRHFRIREQADLTL